MKKGLAADLFGIVIGVATGVIALAAFSLSYAALYSLASDSGVTWWLVWLWPLTLDAVVIAASGVILWNSLRNEKAIFAWILSIAFTGASIWFNTEHAGEDLVAKFVFALPPASLFLVTKLASAQIGAYARKRTAERSLNEIRNAIVRASEELRSLETKADELDTKSNETAQVGRKGTTKAEFMAQWSENGHESAAELARKLGVNPRTAQLWVKEKAQ
jgi:hypothetical protein